MTTVKQTWRYIDEYDVSGAYGLATDEYLMSVVTDPDYQYDGNLRLYNYADYSALCGRFQHLQAEIDIEQCHKLAYDISRRLTGGGAIIMGEDQLGLCLTLPGDQLDFKSTRELYSLFATPLIRALKKLGIQAGFKSKNDLEVQGKKIAGLGVHIDVSGAIQFHASLLYDLDILAMLKVLKIPIQKFDDRKKIWSVNQRMTTIKKEIHQAISMAEVKDLIQKEYAEYFGIKFEHLPISKQEKKEIKNLEDNRYRHADWLFQYSPQEDMTGMSLHKTSGGLLRTYIGLKGETIKSVLITGDFVGQVDLFRTIEAKLKWAALDPEHIRTIIHSAYSQEPLDAPEVSEKDLLHAILLAARKAKAALDYHYDGSCYYPNYKSMSS